MTERKPLQMLEDMLDAAEKIFNYTAEMSFKDFMSNDLVMDAVIWNFQIIGEAASKLPLHFRIHNSQIDWKRIIGFRHCIVHEYFQIDHEKVWKIKEEKLSDLTKSLQELIDIKYSQPN